MTWDSAFLSETDVWSKVLGESQAASQFQHMERSLKLGGFICDIRVDVGWFRWGFILGLAIDQFLFCEI